FVLRLFQSADLRFVVHEIDPDVSIFLEEAHFTHLFEGYAAGSKVGYAAVVKLDAYVGDVRRIAHHGHPARGDAADAGFYDAQHNVYIVDHQVEDHAHVRSAGIELREAVDRNEHRLQVVTLQRQESGIEPLHMPYLEFDIGFVHQFHQQLRLFHGIGHGLFHEHVFAVADRQLAQLVVLRGRRYNVDRIHGEYQLFSRCKSFEM